MLSHIVDGIVLFVACSGLAKVGLFLTITFVCLATSRKFHRYIKAFSAAVVAYQDSQKPQTIWLQVPHQTWWEQAEAQQMSDTLDIARTINSRQFTTVRIFAPETTKSTPWWGLGAESLYE